MRPSTACAEAAPDESMLKEADMSPQQFQAFVTKYSRRLEKLREFAATHEKAELVELPARPAAPELLRGSPEHQAITGFAATRPQDMTHLAAPPRQSVSEDYRQYVEDYFRAVAQTRPAPEKQP